MVKTKNKIKYIIEFIILSISFLLFLGIEWVSNYFGLLSIDELIYHIKMPLSGSSSAPIIDGFINIIIPFVIFLIMIIILFHLIYKNEWNVSISLKIKIYRKKIKIGIFPDIFFLYKKVFTIINLIVVILLLTISFNKINLMDYIKNSLEESSFIKENYVDPTKVELNFPTEKRNLIYIYIESLENTFFSKSVGGAYEMELIPELYELSLNNTSFSNSDMMGGFYTIGATGWTSGAFTAQTAGVPLKIPVDGNSYGNDGEFLPGAYSIGDILEEEGYNQTFLIGSDASFGGRRTYFSSHGNYYIYDYFTAIEQGKIPEDYFVWWGYEDKKLYSYAKEELSRLDSLDEPFNLTMLTTETHHPEGYFDSSICEDKYNDQFMNSISCTSQQLVSFINWIQKQSFYENTTVIIAGDHLSMNVDFFEDIGDYERTVFNLFVNSAVSSDNTNNRLFSSMDMYPTTLASLGVEIEGNRLGLGTNLFSSEETLLEQYGIEEVESFLSKKSNFYNDTILYSK